ncbi:unnamed protein product [Dictyota dichotoma]|uniref:Ribosomal protein L14 n=1 Tax=Dictyota dichotoma TaxID=2876 RepID=Q2TUC3_DICDH|nr:ribosomal protein L14 [Dictyota dichotoma]AAS79072.1 ribosomal protein L14 [Dictyota dichotoma]
MIVSQSKLRIVDNSGGKWAKCIKVKGKAAKAFAVLGDTVVVSVQSLRQRHKSQVRLRVNKSEIHLGVLVQTRRFYKQVDGRVIRWGNNSIVLIGAKKNVLGTRISSTLPRELRRLKWAKLGVLAKGFV